MGDARLQAPFQRVKTADDRHLAIRRLSDAEVVVALGGAAKFGDAYLANVLATEALNRQRRNAALFAAVTLGVVILARAAQGGWFSPWLLLFSAGLLLFSGLVALGGYPGARRRLARNVV